MKNRGVAMIAIGFAFLALSFSREGSRPAWLGLALIFMILGVRRLRRDRAAGGPPPAP
jgi:hypothetical protein